MLGIFWRIFILGIQTFLGFFCKHREEMIHKEGEITIPYTTGGLGIDVVSVRVNVKLVTVCFK